MGNLLINPLIEIHFDYCLFQLVQINESSRTFILWQEFCPRINFEMVMSIEGLLFCEVSLEANFDVSMAIIGSSMGAIAGCLLSSLEAYGS